MTRQTTIPAHRRASAPAPPGQWQWPIRRIGYTVLGLQLAGFLAWSTLLYSRFAVSFDFAV